ncbi:MAG: LuxR C-terminal-related transcriptional regulator [Gammaproteobacteria bacterium]
MTRSRAIEPDKLPACRHAKKRVRRDRTFSGLSRKALSNKAIAGRLFITERTVEAHVKQIFLKLPLETNPDSHRRMLAALTYLRPAT